MTWDVMLVLGVDGIAMGAVYLLAGLGLVLIFSVTRVIFIPFGDIAAFSALSLAALEMGKTPATTGLVATLAALAVVTECWGLWQRRAFAQMPRALLMWGVLPLLPCALAWGIAGVEGVPALLRIAVAIALVAPIAPLIARIALQPVADASVLVLLIISLALHFLLAGLGLLFFGPEGVRTEPLVAGFVETGGGLTVSGQVLVMIAAAVVLSAVFYVLSERTVAGRALRATAVNRVGARLVGIRPARTAQLAFVAASVLAGLIGVLIAPSMTMYYDSGFLIGLKSFVAAILGGLLSYPMTALGGIAVGLVESFASFWSGELKDVIVFTLLIPALIFLSYGSRHDDEDGQEIDK